MALCSDCTQRDAEEAVGVEANRSLGAERVRDHESMLEGRERDHGSKPGTGKMGLVMALASMVGTLAAVLETALLNTVCTLAVELETAL
jgi:hypothetical protein